jgi:hypothetical protein
MIAWNRDHDRSESVITIVRNPQPLAKTEVNPACMLEEYCGNAAVKSS